MVDMPSNQTKPNQMNRNISFELFIFKSWYAMREALIELTLFTGNQMFSTDSYISVVRTPGKWALHLGGID